MGDYTPGFGEEALTLLRGRSAAEHAAFFLPHLAPGQRLLDVGCGEGRMTVELAAHIAPGLVVGVDREPTMTRAAASGFGSSCSTQVRFETATAGDLPFDDGSFERVFVHALLEHLRDPGAALAEARRVLVPGGLLGVATSDWDAALVLPEEPALSAAIAAHRAAREAAGGTPALGRRMPELVRQAGFALVDVGARYDREAPPTPVATYLAARLPEHAEAFLAWPRREGALFAQCWVYAVGRRA